MSTNTVKIIGLQELQAKLEELPQNVARRILRVTVRRVGEQLRADMEDMAPKKTGFLAEHYNVKVSLKNGALAATAYIGPASGVYYNGVTYHKGIKVATGKHPTKGGALPVMSVARFQTFGTTRIKPNDFEKRAFEEWKDWGLEQIIQEIQDELEKAKR